MAFFWRFNEGEVIAFKENRTRFLAWGLALAFLGILSMGGAVISTLFSIIFIGILILFTGVVVILDAFTFWWRKWQGLVLHLIIGILYSITGALLIAKPVLGSMSFTLLVGAFYLSLGIFRIVYSLSLKTPGWGWNFLNGIISLLLGGVIFAYWPLSSLYVLGIIVGIDLLFSGLVYIMVSFNRLSFTSIAN